MYVRTAATVSLVLAGLAAGCSDDLSDELSLSGTEAEAYATAYLSQVEPAPEGDDLADGAGEYVVIEQNADIRVDMGGWYIEDADGNRLSLGIGRQIDPGAELRVYSSCGESSDEAVFVCADQEVLDDEGDVLTLRDSAGGEVATFTYGEGD
ncbi:lamin tail domain-containing protein [Nocardioides pakistanensis]